MKLTVIRDDGAVYKNNISYSNLDMSGVPTNVHALQWKETFGWIEFTESLDGSKPPNTTITDLPQWALDLIPLWDAINVAAEAAAAAAIVPESVPTTTL
jgi:hypothetical protein